MDYQNSTNNLYNLEATPAEGTTRRLSNVDRKKYPDIIVANQEAVKKGKASPYYTNSTQLPVNFTDDLFAALDLQDDIQTKYTGGTVLHAYVGEALPSAESVKKLVKNIAHNYHLPYFTITPTFSICPKHGYIVGEHKYCPKCDVESGYEDESAVKQDELDDQRSLLITANPKKEDKEQAIFKKDERDLIQAIAGL